MNRKIPKNNSLDINVSYILFQADVFQQKKYKREKRNIKRNKKLKKTIAAYYV